jgi:alpha-beta hydrolase superfamily lysophospholipase
MPSFIALAYAVRRGQHLNALVLSGFPASLAATEAFRDGFQSAVDGGLGDQPMDALSAFNAAFEPARTPFDWLSRDEAEVDAYLADPDCGDGLPLTYAFLAELYAAVAPALQPDALGAINCPVQLVTGGQDPAAANGDNARELATALRAAGVEVQEREYADARHELLNELNRDEVTADVVSWLRSAVSDRVEERA